MDTSLILSLLRVIDFSWSISIHLCSVAIAPDPSTYRILEAEFLSRHTTKTNKQKKLHENPFPEHNSEKAFLAKDSSSEILQQVLQTGFDYSRFKDILRRASN